MDNNLKMIPNWLRTICLELGTNPQGMIQESESMVSFPVRLDDGTVTVLHVSGDGGPYLQIECVDAIERMSPMDVLLWMTTCVNHDLLGYYLHPSNRWFGTASLRIRPQSADELRADIATFITRLGMVLTEYRKAEYASRTENGPD